jgi:hypothetical protein
VSALAFAARTTAFGGRPRPCYRLDALRLWARRLRRDRRNRCDRRRPLDPLRTLDCLWTLDRLWTRRLRLRVLRLRVLRRLRRTELAIRTLRVALLILLRLFLARPLDRFTISALHRLLTLPEALCVR